MTEKETLSEQDFNDIKNEVKTVFNSTTRGFCYFYIKNKYKDKDDDFKALVRSAIAMGCVEFLAEDLAEAPSGIADRLFKHFEEKFNSEKNGDEIKNTISNLLKEGRTPEDIIKILQEKYPHTEIHGVKIQTNKENKEDKKEE